MNHVVSTPAPAANPATEQILGIRFFNGSTAAEAVEFAARRGGLVVAPSGTCFERLEQDAAYRRAIFSADLALADSGLMASLWRLRSGRSVRRISGLAYLKLLLAHPDFRAAENVLWILPHNGAREHLLAWAARHEVSIPPGHCYVAPIYRAEVTDPALLELASNLQPAHIVIGLGAGAQEKLGWYLRENLARRPAIHCIGGALGFVTGDQVAIPDWADRLYLGWFLRLLTQPRVFIPRLWKGPAAALAPPALRRCGTASPVRLNRSLGAVGDPVKESESEKNLLSQIP